MECVNGFVYKMQTENHDVFTSIYTQSIPYFMDKQFSTDNVCESVILSAYSFKFVYTYSDEKKTFFHYFQILLPCTRVCSIKYMNTFNNHI